MDAFLLSNMTDDLLPVQIPQAGDVRDETAQVLTVAVHEMGGGAARKALRKRGRHVVIIAGLIIAVSTAPSATGRKNIQKDQYQ